MLDDDVDELAGRIMAGTNSHDGGDIPQGSAYLTLGLEV